MTLRIGKLVQAYTFQKVTAAKRLSGSYAAVMVGTCARFGMKPVCDNARDCKTDAKALYIGQLGHMASPADRADKRMVPTGFGAVAKTWDGVCNYAKDMSGKGRAFCNYGQSSVWQYKGQNNRFVCGKHAVSKQGTRFTGMLGAKNGAPASTYTFLQVRHNKKWGTYQDSECSFEKNLCGFNAGAGKKRWTRATSTNSSKSGPKSAYHGKYFVYLSTKGGKKGDVSYLDYKAAAGESLGNVQMVQFYYHAYGSAMGMLQLEAQRDGKWSVLRVGSEKQGDTLGWHVSGQKMSSASAKWKASPTLVLPGGARHFRFKMTQGAGANSNMAIDKVKLMRGRYSSIMIEECRKVGTKPVCEYRNNCHNDRESLYIGQTYYLTHSSYRNNNNYHACGWNAIRSHWDRGAMGQNICGYSFARGSTDKRAMCSDNNWRTPAQYIGGFMCGVRNHTAMYAHDGYFFALEYDKSNKLHNGKYKQNQRCPGSSEAVANKTACAKAATALGKGWSSSSIVKWTNHQAGCIGGDGGTAASGTMYWNTKGDSNQSKGFPVCRYTTHSGTVTQWAQLPCPKGFFCKGGVRRKCATACSKGLTQITKCTASTDLTCAENPTCKCLGGQIQAGASYCF